MMSVTSSNILDCIRYEPVSIERVPSDTSIPFEFHSFDITFSENLLIADINLKISLINLSDYVQQSLEKDLKVFFQLT